MVPKRAPTFQQRALMILSQGELSTQAMEDIQHARAAAKHCTSANARGSAAALASVSFSSAAIGSTSDLAIASRT
jgi:hypothetical protein